MIVLENDRLIFRILINIMFVERCQDDSDNRFQPVKVHNSLCRMLETESTHLDDDITKRLIMKHMCERKKQNTVATDIIGRSANATHPKETCLSSKGAPQMTVSTFDTDQNDMFNNLDIHSARTRSNSWSSVSPASTPPPSGSRTPSLESLIIASWSSDLEHLPRPTRDQLRNARRNLRHTTSDTSSTDYGSFCSAMNVTCMDKYIMEHVDYKVIAERRKEKRDTYRTIMMKLASAIPSPSASPPRVYDASSSQEWD